jgi:ubiquinone/menaquinone biosynthesis C-methylase UbiE
MEDIQTNGQYDDLLFQRIVIEEMGELLPAELIEECQLARAQSVLEVGCGAGAWLHALAQAYPQLQCIGIEQDERLVKVANALAHRDGLKQAGFLALEINELTPELFPRVQFDLVHFSFLARFILTADYAALARVGAALCRPGGLLCWMETELPVTNSRAFERLVSLLCEALGASGQSFISERMQRLGACLAQPPGAAMTGDDLYKRRHLGITPMLGLWLREAGCGTLSTSPYSWGYRIVHEKVYAINLSAEMPAHQGFVRQTARLLWQVKGLLLRTGVIGEAEYEELGTQLEAEIAGEDFCGLCFLLRVWAQKAL